MNRDIKLAVAGAGLKLWQIADALGIADSCFSRKLRHELLEEEKAVILSIIDKLKLEGGASNANVYYQ